MNKKEKDIWIACFVLADLICLLWWASIYNPYLDMSEDKRFTLSDGTKQQLAYLQDEVTIELYLDGSLPPGFVRLKNRVVDLVDQMQQIAAYPIRMHIQDPLKDRNTQEQARIIYNLSNSGIQPTQVYHQQNGKQTENLIIPGAILRYRGKEQAINFLNKASISASSEALNESVEMVEFNITSALRKITAKQRKNVAIITGHGEPEDIALNDLYVSLSENYGVKRLYISDLNVQEFPIALLIKPKIPFTDNEKLLLDQYIMKGGRVLFFLDKCYFDKDSLQINSAIAFPLELNLDDLLFKLGVRINADLLADLQALPIPIMRQTANAKSEMQLFPWKFTPVITYYASHSMTKSMGAVTLKYASTIDTVKAIGITKTPLFWASNYSKKYNLPYKLDLKTATKQENPLEYNSTQKPVAYLLQGNFKSMFTFRLTESQKKEIDFKEISTYNKIIVVSDGDMPINDVAENGKQVFPLGFERSIRKTFANKDLIKNMVDFLSDEESLLNIRNKQIKLRPLQKAAIKEDRTYWQMLNILLPIVCISLFGIVYHNYRLRTFGHRDETHTTAS